MQTLIKEDVLQRFNVGRASAEINSNRKGNLQKKVLSRLQEQAPNLEQRKRSTQ